MAVVTNFLALFLALVAVQAQPSRLIVATAERSQAAYVENLRRMPIGDALERLRKEGFLEIVRGDRTYAIAPLLAQEELFRNLPAFYRSLSNPDHRVLATNDDPQLARFAQAAFGDRFDRFDQSAFALSGAASIDLIADGRSVTLRRESVLTPEVRQMIESKPLIGRDSQQTNEVSVKLDEFTPHSYDSLHLFMLGKPEYRQFTWAKDFEDVAKVLNERFQELQGVVRKAVDDLFAKLPPQDPASQAQRLEKGQDFATVPGELKQSLEAEVTAQYQRFGFADEAEAERFLARARIGDVARGFKVTGAKKRGSFVSVILYPN